MITPGAILIENGTLLPEPLRLESESPGSGWAPVANHAANHLDGHLDADLDGHLDAHLDGHLNAHQLEQKLSAAGWTFFYMAGAITRTVFGFDQARMVRTALKRLIANTTLQKCNCLEIDQVETRSFLGIPSVTVSGHSRHIQKGLVFSCR